MTSSSSSLAQGFAIGFANWQAGEDPGQKDEVGRTCPEAAVLYSDTDVSLDYFFSI
jgi:hypothetical protein